MTTLPPCRPGRSCGLVPLLAALLVAAPCGAAEIVRLSESNWEQLVPRGKEVDAILGDYVLRNDRIVAVVAAPIAGRNANMTVKDVGGAVIDLTDRLHPNDQLSAFYPGAARHAYRGVEVAAVGGTKEGGAPEGSVALTTRSSARAGQPEIELTYRLADGAPFLEIETTFRNPHDAAIRVEPLDAMRADRDFTMGHDAEAGLFWAHDPWWGQAYGLVAEEARLAPTADGLKRRRPFFHYHAPPDGERTFELSTGATRSLRRKLFPAADVLGVKGIAAVLRGATVAPLAVVAKDPDGPVARAEVILLRDGKEYGCGRTSDGGKLVCRVPHGRYDVKIASLGRTGQTTPIDVRAGHHVEFDLDRPGYVVARITDADGGPIPCKVAFRGRDGTVDPDFGPDTAEAGVKNLVYSANGKFRQAIAPGSYDVIVSRGPEYDAVFTQVTIERGQEAKLTGALVRSVETSGWISSDLHSHSSPSGDNTSSQFGRVLNLLAEHIEFAPCTEHNRVSSYAAHLERLKAGHLMATCPGMELTGSPLPVNHQNAFPLRRTPRTQDGGGPRTDPDPRVQIERLALWDDGSDKLVQTNHPNLVQVLGDRDLDGKPDGGFETMFGWMDVVEVHPPHTIFTPPEAGTAPRRRGNVIFNWLQLLNLGYRVPGVVNTDAHYNFHGSGWLRNYVRSATDDPAKIEVMPMVGAYERGAVVMSSGPFLEVIASLGSASEGTASERAASASAASEERASAPTAGPGEDLAAGDGKVELRVRVQCPNWHDVNRVQVFLNGRPADPLNFTRKTTPDRFGGGAVVNGVDDASSRTDGPDDRPAIRFEHTIPLDLKSDTHVVVATIGEGLGLGPVMGPDHADDPPIAVSNPIFIDVDGGGFKPNGDLLDFPLPIAEGHVPTERRRLSR